MKTEQMMARLLAEMKAEIRTNREEMTARLETKIGPNMRRLRPFGKICGPVKKK
jgi:hypothetical protein